MAPDDPQDDAADDGKLFIEAIRPLEVAPGGVVVVYVGGVDPSLPPPTITIDKQATQVLDRRDDAVVVRLPDDMDEGRSRIRVHQGKVKSKKRDIWLRPLDWGNVLRQVFGGLALFVLGLRTLARGIRSYAGNRMRYLLTQLTLNPWRSALSGVLTGGITLSNVSAAGVVVGLLGSKLLPVTQALALVLGAQLGAAAMALVLPLGFRSAILVVALGVFWVALASDRRGRALGKTLLGLGLLFFGLETLRSGFHPLVSVPSLVHHFSSMSVDSFASIAAAALIGAAATALLQGPGPAFLLVLALTESSQILGLSQGLALLAGVPLGAALATTFVAWPFGGAARRLAVGHLVLGIGLTLFLAITSGVWALVADWLVPGDPEAIVYGRQVLQPSTASHLAVGFLLSQAVAVALGTLLVPKLSAKLQRRRSRASLPPRGAAAVGHELWHQPALAVLDCFADVLAHVREMLTTGERAHASDCEAALRAAAIATEQMIDATAEESRSGVGFSAALALTTTHQAVSTLERSADGTLEDDVRLGVAHVEALERVHQLVSQSVEAARAAIQNPESIDADAARQREIWLNARSAQALRIVERDRLRHDLGYAKHLTLVFSAYEELGNNLFRLYEILSGELDED